MSACLSLWITRGSDKYVLVSQGHAFSKTSVPEVINPRSYN